jgi:hypothetical protein
MRREASARDNDGFHLATPALSPQGEGAIRLSHSRARRADHHSPFVRGGEGSRGERVVDGAT